MTLSPLPLRVPTKFLDDPESARFWDVFMSQYEAMRQELESLKSVSNESESTNVFGSDTVTQETNINRFSSTQAETSTQDEIEADGGTFLAVTGQYILAKNGPIIVLPDYPQNAAIITVEQTDNETTTVETRVKPLQGGESVIFSISGSVYGFKYSEINDSWSIV